MIIYYPTKFYFDSMDSFRVMGREHFPPPPGPGTQQKPGPDRVNLMPTFFPTSYPNTLQIWWYKLAKLKYCTIVTLSKLMKRADHVEKKKGP